MMSGYQFAGTLFRTERDMLSAIASEYLSGFGAHDVDFQREVLGERSDADMAAECISGFGLDQPGEDSPSHMDKHGYSADDLAKAFAALRDSLTAPRAPARAPAIAEACVYSVYALSAVMVSAMLAMPSDAHAGRALASLVVGG